MLLLIVGVLGVCLAACDGADPVPLPEHWDERLRGTWIGENERYILEPDELRWETLRFLPVPVFEPPPSCRVIRSYSMVEVKAVLKEEDSTQIPDQWYLVVANPPGYPVGERTGYKAVLSRSAFDRPLSLELSSAYPSFYVKLEQGNDPRFDLVRECSE